MMLSRSRSSLPYQAVGSAMGKFQLQIEPTKAAVVARYGFSSIPFAPWHRMQSGRLHVVSGRNTAMFSSSACPLPSTDDPSAEAGAYNRVNIDSSVKVDMSELMEFAHKRCTPLSLKDMYKYAVDFRNLDQRLRNAQFLHKELPIRYAQRAVDLLTLPHGLSELSQIRQNANFYISFVEIFKTRPPPTNQAEEDAFTDVLQGLILDRRSIPTSVAKGVDEWVKMTYGPNFANDFDLHKEDSQLRELEDALYRFFTARVGLRFLIEHHILSSTTRNSAELRKLQSSLVHEDQGSSEEDFGEFFLGCIQTDCNARKEVGRVARTITTHMTRHYGWCPEIQILESTRSREKSKFTYVPHHLHYMVGELIKNSCHAVMRTHKKKEYAPPVRVVIVQGDEDVTIKVADRGGGIPRSKMVNIWKFAHPRVRDEACEIVHGVPLQPRRFGLIMSRIYARYFGGELTLKSMEGYGLDAYLHLPRLGDSCENLPIQVRYSPGELNSNPPRRLRKDMPPR